MRHRTVFIDRDGVINVNHGYVHRRDDFEFMDSIFAMARAAQANEYKLIVVTNQSGIGCGYYSEQEFHILTI
jgi:D-glycero-D-manno-heptose 1,7-bisphosphate phosphatase